MTTTKIPGTHLAMALLTGRPIARLHIPYAIVLVDEANGRSFTTDTGVLTHGESAVRRRAERRAQKLINRAATSIEATIHRIKGLHAEINVRETTLVLLRQERIAGSHGETHEAAQGRELHDDLVKRISNESDAGAVYHRRGDPTTKRKVLLLQSADLVVLWVALAKVFNVNYQAFWATPGGWIKFISALVLAGLGTLALSVVTRNLGRAHRAYRRPSGGWNLETERITILGELVGLAALMFAVGALIAARLVSEASSDQNPFLVIVLATLFAILLPLSTYISYKDAFTDGSLLTERLDVLASQIHANEAAQLATVHQVHVLAEQAGLLTAKVMRQVTQVQTAADTLVTSSREDQTIRYARTLHQQAGAFGSLPVPVLDARELDLLTEQAADIVTRQKEIEESLPAAAVSTIGLVA